MRDNLRTLVFAGALALICSLLLAATSLLTAPYRLANEEAEEKKNFLAALEVPVAENAGAETLLKVFDENIRVTTLGDIDLYEYAPPGSETAVAVAVPFSGPGLWAPVRGVLALEPDLRTIRGMEARWRMPAPPAPWRNRWLTPTDTDALARPDPTPTDDRYANRASGPTDWFLDACEELGDAALAQVPDRLDPRQRVTALLSCVEAAPHHEIAHQRLGEAVRELVRHAAG